MEKKDESTSCKILSFKLGKKRILESNKRALKNNITNPYYLGDGQMTIFSDKKTEEKFAIAFSEAAKKRCGESDLSDKELNNKITTIESQQNIHITAINKNKMKKVLNGVIGFVVIPAVVLLFTEFLSTADKNKSTIELRRYIAIIFGLSVGFLYYYVKNNLTMKGSEEEIKTSKNEIDDSINKVRVLKPKK